MTRARKIWAMVAFICATAITAAVAIHWYKSGVNAFGLVAAIVFYHSCGYGCWVVVDEYLKERSEQ